jgi:hypothetical protein
MMTFNAISPQIQRFTAIKQLLINKNVPFRLKLTLFASAAKKKTFRLFAPSPPG